MVHAVQCPLISMALMMDLYRHYHQQFWSHEASRVHAFYRYLLPQPQYHHHLSALGELFTGQQPHLLLLMLL